MNKFGIITLSIIGLVLLIIGLMQFDRFSSQFQENTRRLTYNTSQSYQQGSQRDFLDLCMQYRLAKTDNEKLIIKSTFAERFHDYTGPDMSPEVYQCKSEMSI